MSDQHTLRIESYLQTITSTLENLPVRSIAQVVQLIENARAEGRTVFIFGNGGSAATATHFACDLSKGTIASGKPRIKAISLCDNMALLCAWANDTAYEHVFAGQLENLVEPGDVVIGISGSGNSPNVLNAMALAKAKGAATVGFSGFNGGKLKDMVDIPVVVPNHCMEQIEDVHLLLEHMITTCLREG